MATTYNNMDLSKQYPVDKDKVNMSFLEIEELYEIDQEKNILEGVINPRFIRWYNEDNANDEPLDSSTTLKVRYRTCKSCPYFDDFLKLCDDCGCYMPIKAQLKKSSCPLAKWEAIL